VSEMGFRFWRRIKIAPGVTLNLSKSGGSLSFGPRGAKFTVGSRGKRATVGIPGTGLFYTTTLPRGKSSGRRDMSSVAPAFPSVRAEDRLTLGFFKRLVTPDDEEALVDGCRELVLGNEDRIASCSASSTFIHRLGCFERYPRQRCPCPRGSVLDSISQAHCLAGGGIFVRAHERFRRHQGPARQPKHFPISSGSCLSRACGIPLASLEHPAPRPG